MKKTSLITACCVCGCTASFSRRKHGLQTKKCKRCGNAWQDVAMSSDDLSKWYENRYHGKGGVYTHDIQQDLDTADKRLNAYKLLKDTRLLDLGSGNGAFVARARERGINAYGCEIAKGISCTKYVYEKPLQDVHFPTDFFDVVTIHDAFEHMVDPKACLKEVHRILRQEGRLMLEIPNFHTKSGAKHWKEIEHLWFFRDEDIKAMLQDIGFVFKKARHPVAGKLVFYAEKAIEQRPTILVPPGIGDIYWSLTRVRAFAEAHNLGMVDVLISSPGEKNDRDRSIEYVRRCPFVNAVGYKNHQTRGNDIWKEAYLWSGRTIFEGVEDCDYFIAYNGILRHGQALEDVDGDLPVDWLFPMFESLEEKWYGEELKERVGDYIVGYFMPHGMYAQWLEEFPVEKIRATLRIVAEQSGCKIVLIGAKWDKTDLMREIVDGNEDIIVNLTGETTLEEVFGVLKSARAVLGFPSGITIMSTVFKKPTVILWNKYFHKKFYWYACPPQARENWYDVVDTEDATPEDINERIGIVAGYVPQRVVKPTKAPKGPVVTVACVLKSGGDFDQDYVQRLQASVARHLKIPHRFVCLSDMSISCCEKIELLKGWPGWWSKLELFRRDLFKGRVLYFDLDTVIVGNLKQLASAKEPFMMLRGFRHPERRASGVMAWEGDYSGLYDAFCKENGKILNAIGRPPWDQEFIHQRLWTLYEQQPHIVQRVINVASYKNHCLGKQPDNAPPESTSIVCFHGNPRPVEVDDQWVRENWR